MRLLTELQFCPTSSKQMAGPKDLLFVLAFHVGVEATMTYT